MQGAPGVNGKDAYQSWLDLGNTGTEQDFINSLKVTSGGMSDDERNTLEILKRVQIENYGENIFQAPQNVSINSGQCIAQVPSSFDANSPGATYAWVFDGVQTSTERNPRPIFKTLGQHDVSVTVTNPYGSTTANTTVNVTSPLSISINNSTSFDQGIARPFGQNLAAPLALHWDFGDGETAEGENPSHAYMTAGNFTVTLTGTSGDGEQYTATQVVSVAAGADTNDSLISVDAAWVTDNGNVDGWEGGRVGARAFNGTNDGNKDAFYSGYQSPVWIQINWDTPRKLTGFVMLQMPTDGQPANWQLQGSNDGGATWATMASSYLGGIGTQASRGIALEQQAEYSSIRFYAEPQGWSPVTVGEIRLYEAVQP